MVTEKTALDYLLDVMTSLVSINDNSLEQLQEMVDYIRKNRNGLEEIEISKIVGLEDALASKLAIKDVVDNLISTLTTAPLSANQGRVLSEKIETISSAIETIKSVISSDDTSLDELQEIVNFIKQNKEDLGNLDLSNIAETSTLKHFTKDMLEKLEGIEKGANKYKLPDTLNLEKVTTNDFKLVDKPIFKGYANGTNITAPNVIFDWAVEEDTHNAYQNGLWTCPKDGLYRFNPRVFNCHSNNTQTNIFSQMYINNIQEVSFYSTGTSYQAYITTSPTILKRLKVGDTMYIKSSTASSTHYIYFQAEKRFTNIVIEYIGA